MRNGRWLGVLAALAMLLFIIVGTLWPVDSAKAMANSQAGLLPSPSTPEAAAGNLLREIGRHDWENAYASLANKNEFSEPDFVRDLNGAYESLRTYATLDTFELQPLHATADQADIRAIIRWSTVVGAFQETRNLHLVRNGDLWHVAWPLVKEARVPPQVIPVNYLRWDVIYRGPGDDWGAQDVEAPHVRIIDMHPVDRGGGVVVMGEILNEDVVPAFIAVKATLLAKDGSPITTEDAFDKVDHILLPKQVSPFRIDFPNTPLSQVDSIRMTPSSTLIAASADPVIEIQDQSMASLPEPSLNAKLVNQSGQVVNVTNVLGTFYDKNGQLVWVANKYADRSLLPQIAIPVTIPLPADLASKVNTYRVIASTYSSNRFQ